MLTTYHAQNATVTVRIEISTAFDHLAPLGLNAVFRPNYLAGNLHQGLLCHISGAVPISIRWFACTGGAVGKPSKTKAGFTNAAAVQVNVVDVGAHTRQRNECCNYERLYNYRFI